MVARECYDNTAPELTGVIGRNYSFAASICSESLYPQAASISLLNKEKVSSLISGAS